MRKRNGGLRCEFKGRGSGIKNHFCIDIQDVQDKVRLWDKESALIGLKTVHSLSRKTKNISSVFILIILLIDAKFHPFAHAARRSALH